MSVFFSLESDRKSEPHQKDGGRIVGIIAILMFSIAMAGAFFVSVTSFPFTDGWYETLVFLEKHGLQPYNSLEFVLPPMTIVDFRIIDWLTHSNFAADRLIGVFITFLDAALLFAWMRRFTATAAAAFASAALFVLMTAEPLYIPGDYHDIVQLFLTTALILLIRPSLYDDTKPDARSTAEVALSGVVIQLLLLTKQNVGLGTFLGYLAILGCMALMAIQKRNKALAVKAATYAGTYVIAFALTGMLFLAVSVPGLPAWTLYKSFFLVGSKGSPLYAGTRLLHDPNNFVTIWPAFLIAAVIVLILFAQKYLVQRLGQADLQGTLLDDPSFKRYSRITVSLALAVVPIIATLYLCGSIVQADNVWLWNFWPCIVVFTCYFLDLFSLVSGTFQEQSQASQRHPTLFHMARILIFGMVMLAHSMTAALNIVGLAVFFGYYSAMLVDRALGWAGTIDESWQKFASVAALILSLLCVVKLELSKFDTPYAWWGMQEPPVYASSTKVDLPYLSGLRFSEDRARMITSIVSKVRNETTPSDPILVYPYTPMFYMLTDRLPETKTYVQWFDFATERSLISDFAHVSRTPPKVIIEMSVPSNVYSGHESLLGRTMPQLPFTDYLQCMVGTGAFEELDRYFYNRSRSSALDGDYNLRTMRAISAQEVDQLASLALPASYVVTGALGLDGSVIKLPDIQRFADQKSNSFGGIVVMGNSDDLPHFLKYLNKKTRIVLSPRDDNFILRVLKRTSDWKSLGSGCASSLRESLQAIQVGL